MQIKHAKKFYRSLLYLSFFLHLRFFHQSCKRLFLQNTFKGGKYVAHFVTSNSFRCDIYYQKIVQRNWNEKFVARTKFTSNLQYICYVYKNQRKNHKIISSLKIMTAEYETKKNQLSQKFMCTKQLFFLQKKNLFLLNFFNHRQKIILTKMFERTK